ncbi:hypothetical protein GURKE_01140 [Brevundimonas phage vB_BpoS-Gurke]|uniref:Uncharacterized protein n=1 Tax=Brevundimonas phage vB_BpoS-Gurke TaxID=2948599 RepID=A0A9E7SSN7_9CAUD|nr:hypothetical protein GURKE_01140 [Brevundimonas phage vB_BpoS-Gurke]
MRLKEDPLTHPAPLWCRIFGHRMRPRYDTVPVTVMESVPNPSGWNGPIRYHNIEEKRVYRGDVCARCDLTALPQQENADAG